MAELSWVATAPLSHVLKPGHHGAETGGSGVAYTGLSDFALVQVMARRGKAAALAKAAKAHFGVAAPLKPKAVVAGGSLLIWSGPDQFLALSPRDGFASPLDALLIINELDQNAARAALPGGNSQNPLTTGEDGDYVTPGLGNTVTVVMSWDPLTGYAWTPASRPAGVDAFVTDLDADQEEDELTVDWLNELALAVLINRGNP